MSSLPTYGYAGQLLRVDLNRGEGISEPLDEALLRKYVGGASLGIKFVYDEVPPGVEWADPENRLFLGSGPLGGTSVATGTFSLNKILSTLSTSGAGATGQMGVAQKVTQVTPPPGYGQPRTRTGKVLLASADPTFLPSR